MRNAKEKAKELVEYYFKNVFKGHNKVQDDFEFQKSKQCAIICVDEMYDIAMQNDNVIHMNYLTDVKTELEKI